MSGILGKKIGMTQIYKNGKAIPVTLIESGPCKIVGVKTKAKEGYSAIALSFGKKSPKKTSKAMKTVFEKAGTTSSRIVREFRVNSEEYAIGQDVLVDVLENVEYVDVVGISKGKGFQGVMKRHGFAGGPASHGATLFHRRTGSIGNLTACGRVFPGKKMPGQMGNKRITVQSLEVVKLDKENNLLLVKGSIPGAKNSFVMINRSVKHVCI